MKIIVRRFAIMSICVLFLSGCTTARKEEPKGPFFYPPPPEIARLQYLTSFSRPEEVERGQSPFLTFLIGEPPPRMAIIKPYGLALYHGKLFICDSIGNAVHILDPEEETWDYFSPRGRAGFRKVINIDIDATDGTRYVTDTVRGQVIVFDDAGMYRGTIGEPSELKPTDVKVWDGLIYITDVLSHSVRVYDTANREFQYAIPTDPKGEDEALFAPVGVDIGPDGDVYVSDTGAFRVQVYSADGAYIRTMGKHGDALGEFARNKGVAVDRQNRAYVVDAAYQNIQIFDEEGRLLLFFGGPEEGLPGELVLPASIIIDYDNLDMFRSFVEPGYELEYLVLVSSQYGPRKVSVYGFIHQQ